MKAPDKCPFCNYLLAPPPNRPHKCPRCRKSTKLSASQKILRQRPWKPRAEVLARLAGKSTKPPLTPELGAFGEEIRHTRIRKLLTQPQLAEKFDTSIVAIAAIEHGRQRRSTKDPLLMEKLRIWVETNKGSAFRADNPFTDLDNLLKSQKDAQNG